MDKIINPSEKEFKRKFPSRFLATNMKFRDQIGGVIKDENKWHA